MQHRLVVVALLVASHASASPDRLVRVQITYKRTITDHSTVAVSRGKCTDTTVNAVTFTETASFGSESYPFDDDGDQVSLQSGATIAAKAKAMSGTSSLDYTSETHEKNCADTRDSKLVAHGGGDVDAASISFQFARKSTQGTVAINPGATVTSGSGTVRSHSPPNAEQSVDGGALAQAQANMLATAYGPMNLFTSAQWTTLGPAAAQLRAASEQTATDGSMTVAKTGSGFSAELHEAKTIPADKLTPPATGTKISGERTITTDVSIIIGEQPITYEALLVPVASLPNAKIADYNKFVPIGEKPGTDDAKNDAVAFRIEIIRKDKPNEKQHVPFAVTYTLDTSKEPGNSLNDPLQGATTQNDLEWHTVVASMSGFASKTDTSLTSKPDHGAELMAVVRSRDFGAYGKLHAHVTLKTNQEMDAHLAGRTDFGANIPVDEDNDHIADAWEDSQNLDKSARNATSDQEHVNGNDHDGDGLTLYEEYRGLTIKGSHTRLDPKRKDVFVINAASRSLDGGAKLLERAAEDSLRVHVLGQQDLDNTNKLVNVNSSYAHGGAQHAILVNVVPSDPKDPDFVAECKPKHPATSGSDMASRRALRDHTAASPGDVEVINVTVGTANFDHEFAHELAHGLGVRHHGSAGETPLADYNPQRMIDDNGDPITITNPAGMTVAHEHSAASGDATCLMAYNRDFVASSTGHKIKEAPKLIADLKKHGTYSPAADTDPVLLRTPDVPDGTMLCHSAVGTKHNAPDHKPWPSFGNATVGNCFGQLRVKDW